MHISVKLGLADLLDCAPKLNYGPFKARISDKIYGPIVKKINYKIDLTRFSDFFPS